jgi:hypothetical protein
LKWRRPEPLAVQTFDDRKAHRVANFRHKRACSHG